MEKAEAALREGRNMIEQLRGTHLSGVVETLQQLCDALAELVAENAALRKEK